MSAITRKCLVPESFGLNHYRVLVGNQLSFAVITGDVGGYFKLSSFIDIGHDDLGTHHRGPTWVGHGSKDASENLLSVSRRTEHKQQRKKTAFFSISTTEHNPPAYMAFS